MELKLALDELYPDKKLAGIKQVYNFYQDMKPKKKTSTRKGSMDTHEPYISVDLVTKYFHDNLLMVSAKKIDKLQVDKTY